MELLYDKLADKSGALCLAGVGKDAHMSMNLLLSAYPANMSLRDMRTLRQYEELVVSPIIQA